MAAVLPIRLDMRRFSIFHAPQEITTDGMREEFCLPTDPSSEALLRRLAGTQDFGANGAVSK